jgi:hypothetical protein
VTPEQRLDLDRMRASLMEHPFYRRAELAANIAIIIVASVLCVALVKTFLLSAAPPRPAPALTTISRGARLLVPDVDWSQHQRHVVLVLQKGCHFCSESAPFYRELWGAVGGRKDVDLIAVLPQDEATSTEYLKGLGVSVNEVRRSDLSSVGVSGTPTLFLTDGEGVVTDVWVGKLSPEKEQEVLKRL